MQEIENFPVQYTEFVVEYGEIFGGAYKLFSAVYGDNKMWLVQGRTMQWDTITGERKEVEVCYVETHIRMESS